MAVYRAGSRLPEAFINNVDVDDSINFNQYRTYSASSKNPAIWDFQGVKLSADDLPSDFQVNPFVEVGLKRVIKGHLKHQRFQWHCEWARQREGGGGGDLRAIKIRVFLQKFCRKKDMVPYLDVLKRLKSILLVHGIPIPDREKNDNSPDFFSNKWA